MCVTNDSREDGLNEIRHELENDQLDMTKEEKNIKTKRQPK